jgi:hypothetical protein
MSKLIVAALASLVLLAGCKEEKIKVVPIVTKPALGIADPVPVKLGKVEWIVITEANFPDVVIKLKAMKGSVVIMGVTTEGYKNIRMNEAQLLKLIKQQKSVTLAYRKYYE